MQGYHTIEAQIYYPRYVYMVETRVHYTLLVDLVLQGLIIVQTDYYLSYIYNYGRK